MRCIHWALVLTAIVLLASLTSLLRNAQSCACEQTYMYTSYTEIPMLDRRWSKHRYKLQLYRETSYANQALPPSGLPALLIPGNAGSYEQVRSLASESARLAVRARKAGASIPDLDWYTLDLRSELSAFDGQLLAEQADFATACLAQLKAMYSTSSNTGSSSSSSNDVSGLPHNLMTWSDRPNAGAGSSSSSDGSSSSNDSDSSSSKWAVSDNTAGITLVGHSMGGVVARAAAAAAWDHPDLGPGSITLLLTLASPHQAPPLLLQPDLARFYDSAAAAALPDGLPVASVHGGTADVQVSPYLTRLHVTSSSSSSSGFAPMSISSQAVPGAWLHAGHTQIDWCNQLASRLAAMLMEVHAQQHQQQQQQQQEQREDQRPEQMQQGGRKLQQQQQRQLLGILQSSEQQQQQQEEGVASTASDVLLCDGQNESVNSGESSISMTAAAAAAPGDWLHRRTVQQCPQHKAQQQQEEQQRQADSSGSVQVGVMSANDLSAAAAAAAKVSRELGKPVFIAAPLASPPAATHDPDAVYAAAAAPTAAAAAAQRSLPTRHMLDAAHKSAAGNVPLGHDEESSDTTTYDAAARVAEIMQQFLTGRALTALGFDSGVSSHSWPYIQQPNAVHAGAAGAGSELQNGASTQQQQQHHSHGRHRAHKRPGRSGKPRATTAAAGPGAQGILGRQRHQGIVAAQQQLLLLAPLDVQLSVTGVCPAATTEAAAAAAESIDPDWYVTHGRALEQHVSPGNVTFKVSPAAAAAAAETGSGAKMEAAAAGQGGTMYYWKVPASAADFALLVSGAKPCSGFRVWVQQQQQQQQSGSPAGAAAGSGAGSSVWRDVTGLAAPLPVLQDELVYEVRHYSRWLEVINGKDYLSHAAWTLALTHRQHLAAHRNITRVAVWLAAAAAADQGSSSSNGVLPAAASLTAQWQPEWQQQDSSSSSSWAVMHLGPLALMRSLLRPAGGPMFSEVQLNWRWLISGLSIRVQVLSDQHGSSSSSKQGCWLPVAVYSSSWGGLEHVTVFNTTAAAAGSSVGSFLAHVQQQWIQPWIRSCQKVSSQPGTSSRQSNSLLVSDVRSGDSVRILLDPTCSYSIGLGWDLVDISAQILLSNVSAAAGIVVALLLLVLSHQMSTLLRIIAAAQNGTAAAAAQNGSSEAYAAVTAAEAGSELPPVVRSSFGPHRGSSSSSSEGGAEIAVRLRLSSDADQTGAHSGNLNSLYNTSGHADVANRPGSNQATAAAAAAAAVRSDLTAAAAQKPAGGAISRLARASSSSSSYPPAAGTDQAAEVGVITQAGPDHLGPWQQQQQQQQRHQERDPDSKGSRLGDVRVGLDGLSRTALNKLRRQLLETLGGALPPIQQLTAAAAAAKQSGSSSSQLGISVYASLVAVTSDARVLAAAVTLAAAAAALDRLNPNSLYYWANTAHSSSGRSSSTAMSLLSVVGWLLQQCMVMIGLKQRTDSPGVFGVALLLGVALLFLLVDVWLSVGMKWSLDWCAATVRAFNSSLAPDPATLAAVAAASGASQQQQRQGSLCSCALCTAADAACGGVCGVAAAAAGGFFGGSFCGLDTSACCDDHDRDLCDQSAAAAAAAAAGSSVDGAPSSNTMIREGALGAAAVHKPSAAAPALPWWRQRKCQLQALGLLLLAAVHIALALAATVLLLFSTWHLPSNSSAAAAKVAELLLGGRANSRAASPVRLPTDHTLSPAAAAAVGAVQPGSIRAEAGLAATDRLDTNAADSTHLAVTPAAAADLAAVELSHGSYRSRTASWGSFLHQNSNISAAAAAASAEQLQSSSSVLSKQQQQQRSDVRSSAGLAVTDGEGSHLLSDPPRGELQVIGATHLAQQTLGQFNEHFKRRSTERGVFESESKFVDPIAAGESLRNAHLLDYKLGSSLEVVGEAAAAAGDQDLSGHSSPLRAGRFAALLGAAADQQQQQQQRRSAVAGQRALAKHGSFSYHQQQLLLQQHLQLQQQQPVLIQQEGRWSIGTGAAVSQGASPRSSLSMEQQRQLYYQQRPSIGGTPRGSTQQQHGPDVVIVDVYDAAAARAVALHQLACHMAHAWTLLYGCCCLMLLPSLVAWLQLPLGQQHMSRWRDVLLLLPVLLHCVAMSAGTIEAMVGSRPAATTAAVAKHKSRAISTDSADLHMQEIGTRHIWARWFTRTKLASADSAENDSLLVDRNEPGSAAQGFVHSQPIDLHKLLIRCAAVYVFTAALIGQAVMWSCVVPAVASVMLAGHHAVDAWQTLHHWVHVRLLQRAGVVKHKGT